VIKVLHFADAHLGVENYGRPDPETGLHTRLLDFLRSFDEMIDRAESEEVDLAIFAGDAYKTRNPSPTQQREFATRIMRLAGICPVVLLAGNHDVYSAKGKASTLDIFGILPAPGPDRFPIAVANRPGFVNVVTRSGDRLQIVTLPWIVRSHLLAITAVLRPDGSSPDAFGERLHVLFGALLGQLEPGLPVILAAHGTVAGAVYGSEHSASLGAEIILPPELFYDRRIDYVALGHIHKHQILWEVSPPMIYPGSLDRVDFGEEHEQKGFVIAYLEGGSAKYEFVELQSTRPFVTIEVDVAGDNPMRQVNEAIDGHRIGGAVVRLIIHTTPEANALLRDDEIHAALEGAHYVASIVRDVKRETRSRLAGDQRASQMQPIELLGRYFESKETEAPRAELLLERGKELIQEAQQGGEG